MKRRAFLASLAGAFALDPEKLLWRPGGAKMISVPAMPREIVWRLPASFGGAFFSAGDTLLVNFKASQDYWRNATMSLFCSDGVYRVQGDGTFLRVSTSLATQPTNPG